MLKVGITGEAGSGKSFVSSVLRECFNIPVIDSDSVTRGLMQPGNKVFDDVVSEFGTEFLDGDGFLDRQKLAALVFNDETMLRRLNSLTHPATIAEIFRLSRELEGSGHGLTVIESALALDAGYDGFCDEFWYVYAPETDRVNRLLKARGWSFEKISGVISSQRSEAYFRENCSEVINNPDGTDKSDIASQIINILERKHIDIISNC